MWYKLVCSALLVIVLTVAAIAHNGASGIVKERMDLMSSIGKAMKTIGTMIKGTTAYDAGLAEKAAVAISNHAEKITSLFPADDPGELSEALPAVWESWDEFETMSDTLKTEANKLAIFASTSVSGSEITVQFLAVGNTCKSCHEKFRQKR